MGCNDTSSSQEVVYISHSCSYGHREDSGEFENTRKGYSVSSSKSDGDVRICGFSLSSLSKSKRFWICAVGIFVTYMLYGLLQETILTQKNMRTHSPYLTLYQFAVYSILAYLELKVQNNGPSKVGLPVYSLVALLTLGTIAFSNASVSYLNYPTQVIFKCCKMIPVMIGGVLVQGKSYTILDVFAVLMMTTGLIFFTLVDVTVQPAFTFAGVVLVLLALCCDGALGNIQELVMRKLMASNTELLFYSYSMGFIFLFCTLLFSGRLFSSMAYFHEHPLITYGYGLVFSVCGYFGIHFVVSLIHSHGALTTVTITTLRKAFSIILSFVLFEKPFALGYLWSGLLVVLGIYLNLYSKHRRTWNSFIVQRLRQIGILKSPLPTVLPL